MPIDELVPLSVAGDTTVLVVVADDKWSTSRIST